MSNISRVINRESQGASQARPSQLQPQTQSRPSSLACVLKWTPETFFNIIRKSSEQIEVAPHSIVNVQLSTNPLMGLMGYYLCVHDDLGGITSHVVHHADDVAGLSEILVENMLDTKRSFEVKYF